MVKVRFAPSPTGRLHVGNARVALINWLFAKQHGGSFLLRLDDTDEERSTDAFADGIKEDMQWLGLAWDSFDRQSARYDRYQWAFERLKAIGRLYPCYETPEELELKRKVQLSRGKPPLYDRAALKLTDAQKQAYEAEGHVPHWRFKLDHTPIAWVDLCRGDVRFEGENLSDPILFRANGRPIYTIASVMDDIDHGITHVIRGEDHIANTAMQTQVCLALGGTPPTYGHLSLLTDKTGAGLSKRMGSLSLQSLREESIEPMAINSLLAKLGSSDAIEPRASLAALMAEFDMAKFSRATPKFDVDELYTVNAKLLHGLPYQAVKERLPAGVDEAFWDAVKANLSKLSDVNEWVAVCLSSTTPSIADADFAATAATLLPADITTPDAWQTWTNAIKQQTGRKGKELFMPLRLALTGKEHGPELPVMLRLIGRERALKRLQGMVA